MLAHLATCARAGRGEAADLIEEPVASNSRRNGLTGPMVVDVRSDLPDVAERLGTPQRTLRRAIERGTVCSTRPSPRRLELAPGEELYLQEHWWLLDSLSEVLRTERSVRAAVLFGSVARGDERADSDLDVAVRLSNSSLSQFGRLRRRLEEVSGRPVQLMSFTTLHSAPSLLDEVLTDGRPLVDRDQEWRALRSERALWAERGERDRQDTSAKARAVLAHFAGQAG